MWQLAILVPVAACGASSSPQVTHAFWLNAPIKMPQASASPGLQHAAAFASGMLGHASLSGEPPQYQKFPEPCIP